MGALTVDFYGHNLSSSGPRPDAEEAEALAEMPMPVDVSQLRSTIGGLSCYFKFLPNSSKRLKPVMVLLKSRSSFEFTSDMECLMRSRRELSKHPCPIFTAWDAAMEGSRPFELYDDACRDRFGATLEQKQQCGMIRCITVFSQVTLPNEHSWTILDLEASAIVGTIMHVQVHIYIFDSLPTF